jgi:hypothetical protein
MPQRLPLKEWVLGRPRPGEALRKGPRSREPGQAQTLKMQALETHWEDRDPRMKRGTLGTDQRLVGRTLSNRQESER